MVQITKTSYSLKALPEGEGAFISSGDMVINLLVKMKIDWQSLNQLQ